MTPSVSPTGRAPLDEGEKVLVFVLVLHMVFILCYTSKLDVLPPAPKGVPLNFQKRKHTLPA